MNKPRTKTADTIADVIASMKTQGRPIPISSQSPEERLAVAAKSIERSSEQGAVNAESGASSGAESGAKGPVVTRNIMLNIDLLDDSPSQNRKTYPEEEIQDLATTLKDWQIDPIVVRAKSGGRYEIISGHRRVRATKLLQKDTILSTIVELNDLDTIKALLVANESNVSLGDYERACGYKSLIELGMDQSEIAVHLGLSKSLISARMAFFKFPKIILEALELYPRALSYRSASDVLKLVSECPHLEFDAAEGIKRVGADGWNHSTLMSFLHQKKASGNRVGTGKVPVEKALVDSLNRQICSIRLDQKKPKLLHIQLNKQVDTDKFFEIITQALKDVVLEKTGAFDQPKP